MVKKIVATILLAPRSTWSNWPITTQASKIGWWVRVEDLEEDGDNIQVVVKSLHRDEFHRRGTIGISSAKPALALILNKLHNSDEDTTSLMRPTR